MRGTQPLKHSQHLPGCAHCLFLIWELEKLSISWGNLETFVASVEGTLLASFSLVFNKRQSNMG